MLNPQDKNHNIPPWLEIFLWNKKIWELDSRVGFKVSIVDRFDELLRDLYDLLFTSCGRETNVRTLRLNEPRQNSANSSLTRIHLPRFRLTWELVTHCKSHQWSRGKSPPCYLLLPFRKVVCFPLKWILTQTSTFFSKLKHPVLLVFSSSSVHHPSYLVCMWGSSGSSRYSCPSSLDEIYCVLLPSLPPDTERKA